MKNFDDSTYYHYKLLFNSKITAKTKLFMRLLFLITLILGSASFIQLYTFYEIPPMEVAFIFVQILAGILMAPLLHQLFHGVAYFNLGIYPGLQLIATIGFPTPKWSTDSLVVKRNYIFILSTPSLLGSGVFAGLMVLLPQFWYFFASLFVMNVSLSAVDTYWIWQIRNMHPAVVVTSAKHGFNIYKI